MTEYSDNLTDKTKAPELPPKVVIWERVDFESGGHRPRGWTSSFAASLHPHHYVRADLAAEQVREAYERGLEDAARVAEVKPRKGGRPLSGPHHAGIRRGRSEAARLIRALKSNDTNGGHR